MAKFKVVALSAGLILLGGVSVMLLADSQAPKEATASSPVTPVGTASPLGATAADVPTHYKFVQQIGASAPRGRDISRIALDAKGNVYGVDGDQVTVWDGRGRILRHFGKRPEGVSVKEWLQNPQALTLDTLDHVFVADGYDEGGAFASRVVEYTAAGRFVRTFDGGKTPHPLKYSEREMMRGMAYPLSITTDGHGGLFIADDAGYIWRFTTGGHLLGSFLIPPPPKKPGLNPAFQKPEGLAADGQGHLFVGSAFAVSSGFSSGLLEFTDTGRFLRRFGASGPGAVGGVSSLVWDRGRLFAADQTHNRVTVFDGKGVFVQSFPVADTPPGGFNPKLGLAAGREAVWAADSGHRRLRKFTLAGKIAVQFSTDAAAPDAVEAPVGAAFTPQGNLLITDVGKNCIAEFTKTGKFVCAFGGFGGGPGEFRSIGRVATDSAGQVFVTDGIPGRVEVFSPQGKFLYQFGTGVTGHLRFADHIAVDAQQNIYVGDFSSGQIKVFSSNGVFLRTFGGAGKGPGQFTGLGDIKIDGQGRVFVADTLGGARVQEFALNGGFIRNWKDAHLNAPDSIALNTQGHLLVTADNPGSPGAVLEYTKSGKYLGQFGIIKPEALSVPAGVAADHAGTVAVVDYGHNRVVTFAVAPAQTQPTASLRPKVVAYVPNWNDPQALAKTIDYAKITHLNIAFENPTDDAGNLSFQAGDAALVEAAHAHGVPVLLSIAGGGVPADKVLMARYALLQSADKRAGFVAKIADYLAAHKLDGLDVDLEGPAIGPNYGAFVHDLAKALKPSGKLLTAALSQGYGGASVPDSVFADLDWVNLMAYDATGPWNRDKPGPHSSLAFAKSTVAYWLGRGLPRSKAVLGVPFYGYGFGPAFRADGYTYAEIVAAHPGAEGSDQVGQTIWYNGLPTVRAKTQYVKAEGLAGVMVWSLDQDAAGDRSLLSAINGALRTP